MKPTTNKHALAAAILFMAGAAISTTAQTKDSQVVEEGGTGAYKAIMLEDASLEAHTIFVPKDLSKFGKDQKLPVLVWGNGACNNSPFEHYLFLNEIASHGYIVVATGFMPRQGQRYQGPMSKSEQQIEAIDWVFQQNEKKDSPYYGKIDTKNICVAGMSCGGLQTLYNCADKRITSLMICNSGLFNQQNAGSAVGGMPMPPKEKLKEIHTPIIYILGGEQDIAYGNGMDDFHRISHVPAYAANFPVGHGGTYGRPRHGSTGPSRATKKQPRCSQAVNRDSSSAKAGLSRATESEYTRRIKKHKAGLQPCLMFFCRSMRCKLSVRTSSEKIS